MANVISQATRPTEEFHYTIASNPQKLSSAPFLAMQREILARPPKNHLASPIHSFKCEFHSLSCFLFTSIIFFAGSQDI
jgi:hypothetical protein